MLHVIVVVVFMVVAVFNWVGTTVVALIFIKVGFGGCWVWVTVIRPVVLGIQVVVVVVVTSLAPVTIVASIV